MYHLSDNNRRHLRFLMEVQTALAKFGDGETVEELRSAFPTPDRWHIAAMANRYARRSAVYQVLPGAAIRIAVDRYNEDCRTTLERVQRDLRRRGRSSLLVRFRQLRDARQRLTEAEAQRERKIRAIDAGIIELRQRVALYENWGLFDRLEDLPPEQVMELDRVMNRGEVSDA